MASKRPSPKPQPMQVEHVDVASLRPHPRNYRKHPDDQLAHLVRSIEEHGFYRNVVVAKDGTILAGHGAVEAARKAGLEQIPVVRLPIGPEDRRALKVLAGDNESARLAEVDDRALTEILRDVMRDDPAQLLGTGFDKQMLANLVMITRPTSEIKGLNEAAEWAGMPDYDAGESGIKLTLNFRTEADRARCLKKLGLGTTKATRGWWWPAKRRKDLKAVEFQA